MYESYTRQSLPKGVIENYLEVLYVYSILIMRSLSTRF